MTALSSSEATARDVVNVGTSTGMEQNGYCDAEIRYAAAPAGLATLTGML